VTLITLNEEANIRACLESVGWAGEVLVSDSGSTDGTVAICEELGAKVYIDKWLGFGAQKNLIADRAAGEWILNIDADERVTDGLHAEILEAVEGDGGDSGKDGYMVARKNYFAGRWIRRCGWWPDLNLRLYRKAKARFQERAVHEAVVMEDGAKVGRFSNPVEHFTYTGVDDYLERMEKYSRLAAEEMRNQGRRTGILDLTLRPLFTFLKMYVLKLGFLEGRVGFTLSRLYGKYTYTKYARLKEMGGGETGKAGRTRKDA
jgi:glycosyltransferase involved in cell wall biosynthesis